MSQDDNISKVLIIPVTLEDIYMSYEKVKQARKLIIGTKQTVKAIQSGSVKEVYVAKDADPNLLKKVKEIAELKHVPIYYVDSMKKLGKACGIDVGAAAVGIV